MKNSEIGYSNGFVNYNGAILVVAVSAIRDEKDEPHALLGFYNKEVWQTWEEEFTIVSGAAGDRKNPKAGVLVGRRGDVLFISNEGEISDEIIDGGNNFPNQYSGLNEVKRIENSFYAVGMRRQVYKREITSAKWISIDKGVLIPLESTEVSGFLSIDGFNQNEIYCVGYKGEIWKYNGSDWSKKVSPTNVILGTLTCSPLGTAYIGGDNGIILTGRDDAWSNINQELTSEHIVTSAFFQGKVYFATETGVIICYDNEKFQDVTPISLAGWLGTTGKLNSNGDLLLSVGQEDILIFDGISWARIIDPQFEI